MEVLVSGKTSFKIEVPYKIVETGKKGEKPMFVYLHGYGQNIHQFEKLMEPFLKFNAYHLFIQGPYPEFSMTNHREKFGYAWYLYNGRQGSFVKSLEYTAEFIQGIIDGLIQYLNVNRLCMIGYSMGGYQASYFAFSRWKHTNELIVIGGRIKSELLKTKWKNLGHINVLALHGSRDKLVEPEKQEAEIEILKNKGMNAVFKSVNCGHKYTKRYSKAAITWLINSGYVQIK